MLTPRIGIYTVCAYEHVPEARLELLQNHLVKYLKLQTYPHFDFFITSRASIQSRLCGIGSPESDRFLATFNPYIYDHDTATLHGGIREWSAVKPSMFTALFQRHAVTDQIRRLGMHCHLGKHVQYVRFIEEGYCVWTRHGREQFTQPEQFPETGYSWRVQL